MQCTQPGFPRKCTPHYVAPEAQKLYEADHFPVGDQCDCRLDNLRLRHVDDHRGAARIDWPRKSLPKAQRGLKRPAAELKKKRRELEAPAKKKPAASLRQGVTR